MLTAMRTPVLPPQPLPIDGLLPSIVESLRTRPSLVLQSAPGTGKTTRVPPALLKVPYLDPRKQILVLEPRRLAAKMSARRVAQELGEGVGQTVGYQFRFENMTSPKTRLRFLTEGMLMRKLIGDPELAGVSAVILDEFHERHPAQRRLPFVSQAPFSARGGRTSACSSCPRRSTPMPCPSFWAAQGSPAPVVRADARQYEVAVEYLPSAPAKHLDQTVKDGVLAMLPKTHGDVLVFLPGMAEIRRCAQALEALAASRGLVVSPLHGELSREEQDAAIQPLPAGGSRTLRKIILATNVAETSLTIEGVGVVIDSGLHRQASHSWWSGVPALRTWPTSAAPPPSSARAARDGSGRDIASGSTRAGTSKGVRCSTRPKSSARTSPRPYSS